MKIAVATPGVVVLSALLLGCSGTDDPTPDEGSGGTAPSGGPGEVVRPTEPLLEPPDQGFQLESYGRVVEPGEDSEHCEVARLPGNPGENIYVRRFESALSGYSHHLILFSIPPDSPANAMYDVGDTIPCEGAHEFGEISAVTGSQKPYSDVEYPVGVGRELEGGQMVIFNYHHLNTSNQREWGYHAVNLHTVEASEVERTAKTFAFVNATINTPPRSKASFTGECTFDHDINVWALVRHTHRWGTDFDVSFVSDDRNDAHIWTSNDFELDTDYPFGDPITMRAGEGFRFTCHYDNTTDDPLTFGLKATDEMCILFGVWWVIDPADEVPGQSCGMNRIDPDGIARGVRFDAPGFD